MLAHHPYFIRNFANKQTLRFGFGRKTSCLHAPHAVNPLRNLTRRRDLQRMHLAINRQLAKQEQARARDISARVNVGDSELTVTTTGVVTVPSLRLRLSHPMEADRDFYLTLGRRTDGIYSAPLPTVIGPYWHWTLDTGENSEWRLDGSLSQRDINRAGDG